MPFKKKVNPIAESVSQEVDASSVIEPAVEPEVVKADDELGNFQHEVKMFYNKMLPNQGGKHDLALLKTYERFGYASSIYQYARLKWTIADFKKLLWGPESIEPPRER